MEKGELDISGKSNEEKTPSFEKRIEGVGTIKVYGTLNMDKLITRLLESESITKG